MQVTYKLQVCMAHVVFYRVLESTYVPIILWEAIRKLCRRRKFSRCFAHLLKVRCCSFSLQKAVFFLWKINFSFPLKIIHRGFVCENAAEADAVFTSLKRRIMNKKHEKNSHRKLWEFFLFSCMFFFPKWILNQEVIVCKKILTRSFRYILNVCLST